MKSLEENELRQALIAFFQGDSICGDKGERLSEFLITRSCQKPSLFSKTTKKKILYLKIT